MEERASFDDKMRLILPFGFAIMPMSRRISSSVELLVPNQIRRVRLPYPAPEKDSTLWGVVFFYMYRGSRTLSDFLCGLDYLVMRIYNVDK